MSLKRKAAPPKPRYGADERAQRNAYNEFCRARDEVPVTRKRELARNEALINPYHDPDLFLTPDQTGFDIDRPNTVLDDLAQAREIVERTRRHEDATRPEGILPHCIYESDFHNTIMSDPPPAFSWNNPTSSGQPNKSIFGATTQGAATGLFGSTAPTTTAASSGSGGGGLFGSAGTTPATQQKPLFGAVASSSTGGGEQKSLFGAAPGAGTPSLFGAGAEKKATTFSFGTPATTTSSAATPPATSATSVSLFGGAGGTSNNTNNSATTQSTGSNLFGGAGGAASGNSGSLFGNNSTTPWSFANASSPATSAAPTSMAPPPTTTAGSNTLGGGLFGASTTPQPTRTTPSQFPSTTPAGNPPTSLFGTGQQNQNKPPLSGAGGSSTLFGASTGAPTTAASPFTLNTQAPASGSQPQGATTLNIGAGASTSDNRPSLFSAQSSGTTQQAAGPATTTQPPFSNMFNKPSTSSAAPTATATTSAAPSLFSLGGAATGTAASSTPTTSSTPAPFSIGSMLGSGATGASSASIEAPTTATSGAPAASAGLSGLGQGSLFGPPAGQAAASTPATSGAAAANTTTAGLGLGGSGTGSSTLGGQAGATAGSSAAAPASATTAGPVPGPQSRLAQKTMDEILTMWSTSLGAHQKNFQSLATQVSSWDRQLVENSTRVSVLYGRCFQAERDCSEVERQLSNVEHAQTELEFLLEKYEREVDGLMEQSGMIDGGSASGGVDGERERTYKTADACASRLTEMGQSLSSMIGEINDASTKLMSSHPANPSGASRTPEDPLGQIVRVLNVHLSQLQVIDTGAAALQAKVAAAQREARQLGQQSQVGGGMGSRGQWVDDFGQSYLGRR